MSIDIPHTTEGDIECSCKPLILTVEADGSISRVAGGPLEEPVDTGAFRGGPIDQVDQRLYDVWEAERPTE
jgi:hypothetical protein